MSKEQTAEEVRAAEEKKVAKAKAEEQKQAEQKHEKQMKLATEPAHPDATTRVPKGPAKSQK